MFDGMNSQRDMKATDYTEQFEQQNMFNNNDGKNNAEDDDIGFDMFSTDIDLTDDTGKEGKNLANILPTIPTATVDVNPTLNDNWDDPEGYYSKFT